MKIKTNTTSSNALFEKIASQENEIYIRIFFPNGKFINYLVEPADVEEFGMAAIFEVIDPDPDWVNAKVNYSNVRSKPKRKSTSRIAA
jgi:hypothetical protein